ncbi:MBT domain-containing 1, partial [Pelobates cultripes]
MLEGARPLPRPLLEGPFELTLTTEASTKGWGAFSAQGAIRGVWSLQERLLHINLLELRAIKLALQGLVPLNPLGVSIMVQSDNRKAVAYVNHRGGTGSKGLCLEALDLWSCALVHKVRILAVHVPEEANELADSLSRQRLSLATVQLKSALFQLIESRL